jgi:hypothetical protein
MIALVAFPLIVLATFGVRHYVKKQISQMPDETDSGWGS